VADSALEFAMAHGTPSTRVDASTQPERGNKEWDVFSQLQRTRQWEADGIQLRRPVNIQARAEAETAPQ